jgi:RNA polymerase sigma factor (sigma-70 family)
MTDEELYNRYIKLVAHIAQQMKHTYSLSEADMDDMIASTGMKLIRTASSKRSQHHYICCIIRNHLTDQLRIILKLRDRHVSYDAPMNLSNRHVSYDAPMNQTIRESILPDPQTPATIFEAKQSAEDMLAVLTPEEKEIVSLILGLKCAAISIKQIALSRHRDPDTIARRYRGALDKMREKQS